VRRGFISEADWARGYGYHGFSDDKIEVFRRLRVELPGIADVIRFAVREAFYPEYAREYGLDEEFPPQLEQLGVWLGYPRETMQYYWRAHWDLPSLTMGYEMLHRGIITEFDLESLFKAHDIIPWWRSRLLALSYRVYTRVDVRRMYRLGVLDRLGVKRAYLDLGYDAEKAERMTEFTVAWVLGRDRELTRTDVLRAYRVGQLTWEDALDLLEDLDYSREEAEFLLALEDRRGREEGRELSRSQLEQAFIQGLIGGTELVARLQDMGYTPQAADLIYRLALIRKADLEAREQLAGERGVTRTTLNRALILGVISEAEYRDRMRRLRYSEDAIDLFLEVDRARMVEEPRRLPLGTLREAYRKGVLTAEEFIRRGQLLGYPLEDLELVLAIEARR